MAAAQCLFQRPPSALAQVIPSKFERRDGCVEAQCLCQRLPSALSQAIRFVERRKGGVLAAHPRP